jgi:transcriptional regulator with XRE-family HTH domain
MNLKQLVAANIRYQRKQQGLTQSQAAERIGWTQQAWAAYETGEKSVGIEVLADIARALETTPEALIAVGVRESDLAAAIHEQVKQLPHEEQEELLDLARMKVRRVRERNQRYVTFPATKTKKTRSRQTEKTPEEIIHREP